MDSTASGVYGYGNILPTGYDGPVSENMGNSNPTYQVTDSAPSGATAGGVSYGHHSIGHTNPVFWVLVLALVVTGYIGLGFDFNIKNLFSTRTRVGR